MTYRAFGVILMITAVITLAAVGVSIMIDEPAVGVGAVVGWVLSAGITGQHVVALRRRAKRDE